MPAIKYFLVFFIINLTGNPALTSNPFIREINVLYFVLISVLYLKGKYILFKKFIFYMSLFLVIFIVQAITLGEMFYLNGTLFMLIKIISGVLTIIYIGTEFPSIYWKIIVTLCIISLVGFFINSLGIIIPYLPYNNGGVDGMRVTSILYTQLHNPNVGGSIALRNCGPFWEPGVFQIFINFGFLLLLLDNTVKTNRIYVAICILALLTTYSTTGYITFFLIAFVYIYTLKQFSIAKKILILSTIGIIFINVQ